MTQEPMHTEMRDQSCRPRPVLSWACALVCSAWLSVSPAWAQVEAPAATPPLNSAMDDRLFYQLLIGEMALGQGDAGSAFELILDAARRTASSRRAARCGPMRWQGVRGSIAASNRASLA